MQWIAPTVDCADPFIITFIIYMNGIFGIQKEPFFQTLMFTLLVIEVAERMCWWRSIKMSPFVTEFFWFLFTSTQDPLHYLVHLRYRGQTSITTIDKAAAHVDVSPVESRQLGCRLQPSKKPMDAITFSTLPAKIHVSIATYCKNHDLINLCIVSKLLNQRCLFSIAMWIFNTADEMV